MGGFKYYKTYEKAAVADGGTYEDTWRADENLKIKRVHVIEKGGTVLRKSTLYLKVKERVHTHAVVPCNVLGEDMSKSPVLDFALNDGETLAFTLKNGEGASKDFFITFEAWEP